MDKLIWNAKVLVVWNARTSDKNDPRFPQYVKAMAAKVGTADPRVIIILTPMRNGLFRLKVVSLTREGLTVVREEMAPLFNNSLANRRWLPLLLKSSCLVYQRFSASEPAEPFRQPLEPMLTMRQIRAAYWLSNHGG